MLVNDPSQVASWGMDKLKSHRASENLDLIVQILFADAEISTTFPSPFCNPNHIPQAFIHSFYHLVCICCHRLY